MKRGNDCNESYHSYITEGAGHRLYSVSWTGSPGSWLGRRSWWTSETRNIPIRSLSLTWQWGYAVAFKHPASFPFIVDYLHTPNSVTASTVLYWLLQSHFLILNCTCISFPIFYSFLARSISHALLPSYCIASSKFPF